MENGSLAFHSDERGFIVFFLRQGVRDMLQCTLTIKTIYFRQRDRPRCQKMGTVLLHEFKHASHWPS